MTTIAFAWPGFPDYAARCIRAVIERRREPVPVIATRPRVPIDGMEYSLGQAVEWIDGDDDRITWGKLRLATPTVFIQGGYVTPAFNALGRQCRASGGKVVLTSDQNWIGGLRQYVRLIYDPLVLHLKPRSRFDAVFVPGRSGKKYYESVRCWAPFSVTGLYGADPGLFNGGPPLDKRPNTFLFVGQFIPRKNVLGLARAFARFAVDHPKWTLRLCGAGAQLAEIPRHPQIRIENFVQPPRLAELLREARCLVLPSREEHWGLVVHEAALCGCALALSNVVGATDDLARQQNAVLFPPGDERAIERALRDVAVWDRARWLAAESTSRDLAAQFGPKPFADAVDELIRRLVRTSW